jgi:Flp pilus assembly protein protease CpaA
MKSEETQKVNSKNGVLKMLIILTKIFITLFFLLIAYYDFKDNKIYNISLLGILPLALMVSYQSISILLSLGVAVGLSVVIFLMHIIPYKMGKVGGGDVKIISLLPFIFNPATIVLNNGSLAIVIFLMCVLSIPFAFIYPKVKNAVILNKKQFPLGVPMALSALITIWFF